jgi:hypothetical protein
MANSAMKAPSLYLYQPSHVLPAVFAALIGISLAIHIFQNLYVTSYTSTEYSLNLQLAFTGSGE